MTCSCSIHSQYIGAPPDNRSAPVFRIPGRWVTLMERNGPLLQRIIFCAIVCNTRVRKPPWWFRHYCHCVIHPHQDMMAREGWEQVFQPRELNKVYVKTLKSWALASSHRTALIDASPAEKAGICGNHFSGRDNAHGYPLSQERQDTPVTQSCPAIRRYQDAPCTMTHRIQP